MTPNMTEILLSLPNPFTPMAFLPPELAWQVSVARYWIVGSLAVFIWDIVSNLHSDFILLTKYRINLPVTFYFISRIFSLAYILSMTVLQTAPVGNCGLFRQIQVLFTIAMPSTSLLFLVRVCALYYNNKFVVAFFLLTWLGVLGACITPTQGVHAMRIGISDYCIGGKVEGYVILAGILPFVYDTIVFAATSFAFLRNSHVEGVQNGFRVLVFGNYLPAFSKAILQDGQVYYLATIGVNLATIIMLYTPKVPVAYANSLGVTCLVLMNMLACLVYRKVRFGIFRETAINPTVSRTFGTERQTMPNFQRRITVSFKLDSKPPEPGRIQILTEHEQHDQESEQKIQMRVEV